MNMKKYNKITFAILLFGVLVFGGIPVFVNAVECVSPGSPAGCTPGSPAAGSPGSPAGGSPGSPSGGLTLPSFLNDEYSTLPKVLNLLLDIVMEVGAIIAVLFIVWSGFLFIKAQGNPEGIKKAKSTFFTTIIGAAIVLGASVIAKIILNTLTQITGTPFGG